MRQSFYLYMYYHNQNGATVLYSALLSLIDKSNGSGIGSGNKGLESLSEGNNGSRLTKVNTLLLHLVVVERSRNIRGGGGGGGGGGKEEI